MRLSRVVLWLGFALAGVWLSGCGGGSAVPRDSEPVVFEDEDPASGSGQPKVTLTPSDYMPLSVGKSWQYQATGGSLTRKLTKTVSSGGQTWYVVEVYQPKVAKVVENWRTSSSAVVLRSGGVTREVLRLPLTVGATWQDAMAHTVISTNATVTVPFGTFTGCAVVDETQPASTVRTRYTFAPGMGLIVLRKYSGATLTAYNNLSKAQEPGKVSLTGLSSKLLTDAGAPTKYVATTPGLLVPVGADFTVPLTVAGCPAVAGGLVKLQFDPAVVSCADIAWGSTANGTVVGAKNLSGTPGVAVAAFARQTALKPSGGLLANLQLHLLAPPPSAATPLQMEVLLTSAGGQTIGRLPQAPAPTQPFPAIIGDLLQTGGAEVGSAVKIMRVAGGLAPTPAAANAGLWDCDKSAAIDAADATKLLGCVVGTDTWPLGLADGPYVAMFWSLYSDDVRGVVFVDVDATGHAVLSVDTGDERSFEGTGTVDAEGNLTGTLEEVLSAGVSSRTKDGAAITMTGKVQNTGGVKSGCVSATGGAIIRTLVVMPAAVYDLTIDPFSGHYHGQFGSGGLLTFDIRGAGRASGTISYPSDQQTPPTMAYVTITGTCDGGRLLLRGTDTLLSGDYRGCDFQVEFRIPTGGYYYSTAYYSGLSGKETFRIRQKAAVLGVRG